MLTEPPQGGSIKKRKRVRPTQILTRTAQVSSAKARVSLHAREKRGYEPRIDASSWLELHGVLEEPVREVQKVVFSLFTRDNVEPGTARPLAIGSIINIRPELSVVVGFAHSDFQNIWSLALLGQLKFAYLAFTKPYYNSALVTEISFSTERGE